jgi:uncharacterized lipoprotein YddW (UPF0748 family)
LLSLWLVLALWQAPIVPLGQFGTPELRGVWMTNYGAALMYYTTRLDDAIADLAKHRLNTLYPAVWNRGATLHPSAVVKRAGGPSRHGLTSLPLLPFQDVLVGLVQQSHRQHLRLIPWFEYGLMISPNAAIARAHPDWLTQTQTGQRQVGEHGQVWLNPVHPQVQQLLTDLIVEVVKRYPVDGIQLDDHFAFPIALGYDAYTVSRYQATHDGQSPPTEPTDPEWMDWRAAHLTQLMTKISQAVKAARPKAVVSLSPLAADFAYRQYLQDWAQWVELGLLDEVTVQVYRPDLATFTAELNQAQLRSQHDAIPLSIGLYSGRFFAPKSIEQLQQEVQAVRQAGYSGVSFFCWETTLWIFKGSSPTQTTQGLRQLFPRSSRSAA